MKNPRPLLLVLICASIGGGLALAQGGTSSSSRPASGDTGDGGGTAVQIGAGSTGEVTNGASGSDDGGEEVALAPWPPGYRTQPPVHPFYGPSALPIQRPEEPRCALIASDPGRAFCLEGTNKEVR